ncbi:MAG: hypothetical protein Q8K89_01405, partial [Actinomycetota bacterium]|nr:hypothetical protein [Actinomycetota bacterium]
MGGGVAAGIGGAATVGMGGGAAAGIGGISGGMTALAACTSPASWPANNPSCQSHAEQSDREQIRRAKQQRHSREDNRDGADGCG